MAFDDPTAVDGYALSSLEWRRSQAGLLVHSVDPQSAMPGVLAGYTCTVAGTTLTYGVGSAVVTPSTGANGSYLAVAGTSGTVSFVTSDPTYARIDRVVLRVYDTAIDGSGQTKAALEIIQGTAAASPVAPTLPAGRLELYQAQVPAASGAITLVDKRIYTASAGGMIVVGSYAALPSGSWLRPGQRAYTSDYGVDWRWTGSVWRVDGVPTFATTAARDAGIPTPVNGDQCQVPITVDGTTWNQVYTHTGSAWAITGGDSGWHTITAGITWGSFAGAAPTTHWPGLRWRMIGNQVLLHGLVSANGAVTGGGATVFTITAGGVLAALIPAWDNGQGGGTSGTTGRVAFMMGNTGVLTAFGTWAAGSMGVLMSYYKD